MHHTADASDDDCYAGIDDASDSGGSNPFPLPDSTLTRDQLIGVTALACDGPRLVTGNAEGRVFFQDFMEATLSKADMDAGQPDAETEDQQAAGSSKFWYRPR